MYIQICAKNKPVNIVTANAQNMMIFKNSEVDFACVGDGGGANGGGDG